MEREAAWRIEEAMAVRDTDLGENARHAEVFDEQAKTFSPELKQQTACLVLDQGDSHTEASRSVGIGESVLRRWLQQLQLERQGITP